ncbi:hypothetical protein SGRIM128S_02565 [Streptomyces griseomycini]
MPGACVSGNTYLRLVIARVPDWRDAQPQADGTGSVLLRIAPVVECIIDSPLERREQVLGHAVERSVVFGYGGAVLEQAGHRCDEAGGGAQKG